MPAVRNWHVPAASALLASSVIAVTPVASPPDLRVANLDLRLTATGENPLDDITTFLASAGTQFSDSLNNGLDGLNSALNLDSLMSELNNGFTSVLGGLLGASNPDGSIGNFAYNFIADTINIPYQWSLALKEEAYALGPAGSIGGVAGRIPPGTPDSAIYTDPDTGEQYYAQGGTGSWWNETIGNTWGWDNGNWPQVDGIGSFLLPFNWAQHIADLVQGIMQAESIDGSQVDCEFECVSFGDYLGQWFHTPLSEVLSPGYTYPYVPADTEGQDIDGPGTGVTGNGIINVGPTSDADPDGTGVIWSGQQPDLSVSDTMNAIWNDWTAPAADNPIEIPNPLTVLGDAGKLFGDLFNDYDPLVTGGFLYWGAPTLYSIPALIAGLIHDLTGGVVPNPFGEAGLGEWQEHGREPDWGYTAGPSSLLSPDHGLGAGFQYLFEGLQKYLDPSEWDLGSDDSGATGALSADLGTLLDPGGSSDLSDLLGSLF